MNLTGQRKYKVYILKYFVQITGGPTTRGTNKQIAKTKAVLDTKVKKKKNNRQK